MIRANTFSIQSLTFILIMIVFFFLKLEDCYLPYYWDELGVYSQASLYMYDHTPSLLPGSLPDVLSRGHPLLFMFVYACFFKLFGTSLVGAHIFTCLISILFLGIAYQIGKRFFSADIALLSVILMTVQPLFFAQAVFVLPEIMLGVFSLLSIYFYLDKKLWTSSLYASLALLTKETAIVLPIVMLLMEVIRFYRKELTFRQLISSLLIIFIPFYVFGLFIIIQRIQNGWFFYPYHTGFISFDPSSIYWRLTGYLNFIFIRQGRITWLIVISVFTVVAIFRHKTQLRQTILKKWQEFPPHYFVFATLFIYVLGILGYSALNFPLQRYVLLIYPVFTLLIVWMVFRLVKEKKIFAYPIVLALATINLFYMKSPGKMVENDMAYKDLLTIQVEICRYFDTPELKAKTLASDFPVTPSFFDPRLGYVTQTDFRLTGISDELDPEADYYIYTNPGNLEDKAVLKSDRLQLIKEFRKGAAEGYIYKVIK